MNFVADTFGKYIEKRWGKLSEIADINQSDMSIVDTRYYYREMALGFLKPGGLAARYGELYASGAWNSDHLDTLIYKITGNQQATDMLSSHWTSHIFDRLKRLKKRLPESVGRDHYDIPVALYERMLGPTMKYTAPEWNASYGEFDLDLAQKLAMEMICQRAELSQGQQVLEIGFGYGTLASHMIANYGVELTGLTVSEGQKNFALKYLQDNETIQKADFLNLDWKKLYTDSRYGELFNSTFKGKFDHIVSIEMIEAVSTKDLPLFFKFLFECLNDDGILFFQAINSDRKVHTTDAFIDKYIFPDGVVPQHSYMTQLAQQVGFSQSEFDHILLTDSYDKGLMQWYENLEKSYPELASELDFYYNTRSQNPFPYKDIPSFLRIFEYYLKSCAGAFRSRYNENGQYKFYKGTGRTSKIIAPTKEEVEMILRNKF